MRSLYTELVGKSSPLEANDACKYYSKTLLLSCKMAPTMEASVRAALKSQGWSVREATDGGVSYHKEDYEVVIGCPASRTEWCAIYFHRRLKPAA